jgi:hypothetical protein
MEHESKFDSETNIGVSVFLSIGVEIVGTGRDHGDETRLSFEEADDPEKSEEHEAGHVEHFLLEFLVIIVADTLLLVIFSLHFTHTHYAQEGTNPNGKHNHCHNEVANWHENNSLGLGEEIGSSINNIDGGFELVVSAADQ